MFGAFLKQKRLCAEHQPQGQSARRPRSRGERPRVEALEARVVPTVLDLSTAPGLSGMLHGTIFTGATNENTVSNGVLDAFVQLQNTGVEQGFNSSVRPYNSPNDAGTDITVNHAIQRHAIPIVTKEGITYYEFALTISQLPSAPLLSLDELRIYVSPSATLNSYDPNTGELDGLTPVYDMDGGLDPQDHTYVKLNSNFGANGITLLLDVPTSDLGVGTSQIVYLYSKFGVQNLNPGDTTGSANGGFEQWSHGDVNPLQPIAQVSVSINESSPAASSGVSSVPENSVVYATSTVTPASGTATPTGTVTYYFYDTSSPILGTTSPVMTWPQDVTLNGGSVPPSPNTAALTPGSYSFIAVYGGDNTYLGTVSSIQPLTVAPAAVTSFSVDTPSGSQHAGYPFPITVTARDAYGNPVTDYTGTVHFTSSDGVANLPPDYTFTASDHGVHTFSITLQTPGQQTLSVADTANPAATGSAGVLVDEVIPGLHFSLVPSVTSTPAGMAFSLTVTAYDENNQVATGYRGTIHFTSTDHGTGVFIPADYTFMPADNGMQVFNHPTLVTAGPQTISIDDTSSPDTVAASTIVTVLPGAAMNLSVSGFASPVTAGTAGQFTVSALDAYGNLATGYSGTVHFSSSDAQAMLPADYTFTASDGGSHTFTATFETAGPQTLQATDTATASIHGAQIITVLPAAVASFQLDAPMTPQHAGYPFTVTVTARDAYHNVVTDYTGRVHFTCTDGAASLPPDYTFTGSDSGVHSFSVTLQTPGQQKIGVADAANSTATGSAGVLVDDVIPGLHFTLVPSVSSTPAGMAFSLTVTAYDGNNQVATGYQGTIHFSTTDKGQGVVLPPDYTFTAADNGVRVFYPVTLVTAGPQTLRIVDISSPDTLNPNTGVTVLPGMVTTLSLSGFPSPVTAGTASQFTVSALDAYGNLATGYSGTVHFSSSDAQASLPADSLLTNGSGTFTATLKTAGTQSLTASDSTQPSLTGTQTGIQANPAGASTLSVTGFPASITAGVSGSFVVTARDAYGNVATSYAGTIHFASSDIQAVLPGNTKLTDGVGTFEAAFHRAGIQSLAAADTAAGSITGGQTGIIVTSAAASKFSVSGFPSPTTAGTVGMLTVTALDAFGNVVDSYAGTIRFSSSDAQASLPGDATLRGGTGTFNATLKTAGEQSLSATDTASPGIVGVETNIRIAPAKAVRIRLDSPVTATAGKAFAVTVTALDSFNNTASGYRGTVRFTSSDANAALPLDYAFTSTDAGVYTFEVTLKTAGNESITATDKVDSFNPAQIGIAVSAAVLSRLVVAGYPQSAIAGVAANFTVTAEDAYGNTVTHYAGTIVFSSRDSQATLPPAYTFSPADNGTHSFTATLKTAGTQSITATDSANTITGTEGQITVDAAAVSQLAAAFPSATTAGVPATFTVTAEDTYGNPVTGYTSTVFFSSSDPQAVLPPPYTFSTADDGSRSFTATLNTPGTQTLGVIASDSSFSAMQTGITVTPSLVGKVELIGSNLAGIGSGMLAADSAYIGALYQSLLNRPADSSGLSHWLPLLLAGFNRQQLATAIWQSPEHRSVEVDQYYATFLGRSPDPTGQMLWVNAFLAGATEVDIMRGFLTSPEYQAAHPTDASFVTALYSQVLGRAPDAAGQTAWLLALQKGLSRQGLAQSVLTSAEADQTMVDQYYQLYLDRAPDPAGEQAWTDLLVSGRATLESVGEAILASDEYFRRAATT